MQVGKEERSREREATHADRPKLVAAGALLLVPVVALMWLPGYGGPDPELLGFPFAFWYPFLWVFLCAAMAWAAYLLTLSARRDSEDPDDADGDADETR